VGLDGNSEGETEVHDEDASWGGGWRKESSKLSPSSPLGVVEGDGARWGVEMEAEGAASTSMGAVVDAQAEGMYTEPAEASPRVLATAIGGEGWMAIGGGTLAEAVLAAIAARDAFDGVIPRGAGIAAAAVGASLMRYTRSP